MRSLILCGGDKEGRRGGDVSGAIPVIATQWCEHLIAVHTNGVGSEPRPQSSALFKFCATDGAYR